LENEEMTDEKIQRINELYRKSKAEGLTDAEKKEQQLLRKEFIANVRGNLVSQLNAIDMVEADGTIENLGEKYGKRQLRS
jgi:uncharacterized protein YnzC (UPF0291/DUF896 family)